MIANAGSIEEHVAKIKNGVITKVNVSVKNIGRAKKITVGILEHVFLRIVGT